jgi:hypothetical protein
MLRVAILVSSSTLLDHSLRRGEADDRNLGIEGFSFFAEEEEEEKREEEEEEDEEE